MSMDDYSPQNVLHNIIMMEEQKFGESKKMEKYQKETPKK